MRRLATTFVLVCVGGILAMSTPVLAKAPVTDPVPAPGPISTSLRDGITLRAPSVIKAGQQIDVDATLAVGGYLRADAGLHFIIDDVERRLVRTDAAGVAHFRLRGVLTSGVHHLLVTYRGTSQSFYSAPASATATFVVAPLVITVQVVPAISGITLTLDRGRGVESDAAGEATLPVARAGLHNLAVSLPAPDQTSRLSFVRWSDDSWVPSRIIRVVNDVSISVGLRAAYLTPIRFVGLDSTPLDPTRVSDVRISGPNAEVIQLQYPYAPIWLQTPMPAKHSGEGGLHVTPAPYSLSFATYNRLNVASTGQMRYTPTAGDTWSIKLLLFTLSLGAKDALFGTTLNDPIRLTGNTTGRAQIVTVGRDGTTTLVLSRGNYSAQVLTSGITPVAAIALSRSQEVIVPVITPADLILIGFTVFVIVATVFVAGRGRFWAFGRFAAVRVRYADPIAQRWEGRASLRGRVSANASMVEEPAAQVRRETRWEFEAAENTRDVESRRDAPSLEVLDGGFATGGQEGSDVAVQADPSQETSVALRAALTFPRSYILGGDSGVGRSVEVGLLIRGLLGRGKAQRFLLLVQQSEIRQWQRELKEKFGLQIPRFEQNAFYDHEDRALVWSGNPWGAFPLILVSSHLARRRDHRNELLAGGPWDVVFVDEAHAAHRSGRKPTGAPNKLLALLQVMKSGHSWKTVYLASSTTMRMRLFEAWDVVDLLGLDQMSAEVADDFTRYFTIPYAERPEGDWEFLRQMCADYLGGTDKAKPRALNHADGRLPRSRRTRRVRRMSAERGLTAATTESTPKLELQ
jgi:hypothetical protein